MIENNIDWIETVKLQENGYLVNDSMSVPKSDGNRHYEDVKVWLESNTPEPEFTPEEIAQQEQETVNSEARQSLASSDWQVIRELERLYLSGSELNTTREVLRASVGEV